MPVVDDDEHWAATRVMSDVATRMLRPLGLEAPLTGPPAKGWIAVDLDGTLARYDGWRGVEHIGEPIPEMVERVKGWIASGQEVRIMTARYGRQGSPDERYRVRRLVEGWCLFNIGKRLTVTCEKDYDMIELWDDRAIQVMHNEGVPVPGQLSRVDGMLGFASHENVN